MIHFSGKTRREQNGETFACELEVLAVSPVVVMVVFKLAFGVILLKVKL